MILLIGTFLLVWSMNKHLKKLPESFDPEHPEPDQAVDDGTVVTSPVIPAWPRVAASETGGG